jgi:hypothetical protein
MVLPHHVEGRRPTPFFVGLDRTVVLPFLLPLIKIFKLVFPISL